MPELPEVTTTVNGLRRILPRLVIDDVWTDLAKENPIKQFINTVKDAKFFKIFRKEIAGVKIISVERRAKNILINLSNKKTILIHLKMTGHLIYGLYIFNKKNNKWLPDKNEREELHDPYNRFIHVVFKFKNGKSLAFCDARKFGKVTLLDTMHAHQSNHLNNLGPEPLEKNFNFGKFKNQLLKSVASKKRGIIKTTLMDQSVIAGIGNIYGDEMLWLASIHPESNPKKVPLGKLRSLYKSMREVLLKGINFGGDSMSDYRDIDGKRGNFQNYHNVYRRVGEKCGKNGCGGVIIKKVINSRSAHFCNKHQVKY